MFRILVWFFISALHLFSADLNSTKKNFVDTTHEYISEKVENISSVVDDITHATINYTIRLGSDENETKLLNTNENLKVLNQQRVDELFQNEKYIEETKKSFLRLSTDYSHNSLDDNSFNVRLNAKLALNKSTKNFKIYLSGFNQDNVSDIAKRDEYGEGKPEVGISYVTQLKKNIETKYSLGLRSLYPYVKGRFSYTNQVNSWTIEPVQSIEYSIKDEFKEYTKLYLDTSLIYKVKFRLEFRRGTSSKSNGMDYNSIASIFWTPQTRTGLKLSQGIYGNTKYEYVVNKVTQEKQIYNEINNYVTTLTFRQNVYRKWLFYEISPSVNFHKKHDFKPNYRLYLRLDMFFGKM